MEKELESIRVLVVDDERDIRDGSERILKRIGYEVHTATRGDEALKEADRIRPCHCAARPEDARNGRHGGSRPAPPDG